MVDYHTREKYHTLEKISECDIFSRLCSSTITPSTKGSVFFIILNVSSKENFEFLMELVNQWDTLCTYHYLNKATTTIISKSNIFIMVDKGNNKITELRTILQRESQNS